MILSKELEFSDAQAVTATADSTNVIDLNSVQAIGEELYITVEVDTLPVSGGASTLIVTVNTDDNAAMASSTAVITSASFLKAALGAGEKVLNRVRLPSVGLERYLELTYTVGTADYTAGNFSAYLTQGIQQNDFTA